MVHVLCSVCGAYWPLLSRLRGGRERSREHSSCIVWIGATAWHCPCWQMVWMAASLLSRTDPRTAQVPRTEAGC